MRRKTTKKKATRKRTTTKARTKKRFVATKKIYKQTGTRVSLKADRKRTAIRPGKRISAGGNAYTETRKNRSDMRGKRI